MDTVASRDRFWAHCIREMSVYVRKCLAMRMRSLCVAMILYAFCAAVTTAAEKLVYDFTQKAPHAYAGWDGKVTTSSEGATIDTTAQGGLLVNDAFDLTGFSTGTPALRLKVVEGHSDTVLRIVLRDADGSSGSWDVPLDDVPRGQAVTLHAVNATALTAPTRVDEQGDTPGMDLGKLIQFHIQGSWRGGKRVKLELQQLLILPESPEFAGMRERAAKQAKAEEQRKRMAEEAERKKREAMTRRLAGSKSDFVDLTTANDQILVVHFDDGWVDHEPPSEGRKYDDVSRVHQFYLNIPAAENVETWTITSTDDPNFAVGIHPVKVGRKSRGTDFLRKWQLSLDEHVVKEHWLYLGLAKPLKPGKTYTIDLSKLARNTKSHTFVYDPKRTRSETVHVNQLGYVPGAIAKYAYLSHFMGSFGRLSLDDYADARFHLVDQTTGQSVFNGPIKLRKDFETGDPDSGRPDGEDGPGNNFAGARCVGV